MREIVADLGRWSRAGDAIVLARVVRTDGSAPRGAGAAMAVNEAGEVAGSVSGGCVEGAVVDEALAVLAGRRPPRVVSFGYSDDDAFAVGLTCGGTIHLWLAPLEPEHLALAEALRRDEPAALASVIGGDHAGANLLVGTDGTVQGTLGDAGLDRVVTRDVGAMLDAGTSATRHYGAHGEPRETAVEVFLEAFAPAPRLVIFGAVDFTAALARAGKLLGYQVAVCDPREVFATTDRLPMADEVTVDWPDRYLRALSPPLTERDAVCVLTHDAKFDVPAIVAALETEVGYLGAMGSRRTHARRLERLRSLGVDDAQLARLMAPIGLDLGARSPEEVAIAICAEIITVHTGRSATSLRDTSGPIHDAPVGEDHRSS